MNGVVAVIGASAFTLFAYAAKRVSRHYGMNLTFIAPLPVVAVAVSLTILIRTVPLDSWAAIRIAVLIAAVTVCAITDYQTGYVFDVVTLPAIVSLFALALFDRSLSQALAGTAVTGIPLLALFCISRGRWIGLGDAKLALSIGAALGAQRGTLSLAVAFILGGAFAAILLLRGAARRGQEIRFAPFLALGVGAVMASGL